MPKKVSARIQDHFVELTDPRRRKVTYPLINIVTIAMCAVICGADDFVSIAEFGRKKRKWLAQFLDLRNGIPSHDRFNAILGAIKEKNQFNHDQIYRGLILSNSSDKAKIESLHAEVAKKDAEIQKLRVIAPHTVEVIPAK
jgi:hypothetical protein